MTTQKKILVDIGGPGADVLVLEAPDVMLPLRTSNQQAVRGQHVFTRSVRINLANGVILIRAAEGLIPFVAVSQDSSKPDTTDQTSP